MSYPYTKPQSRYGFRRRWNDPRVGLVGSGPGRPLRRYADTNPEVGLPQRGPGLGSLETPVTEGIFNVGPARGFTRGVFTSNPPYATPRYIAEMPEGIAGMGCCGGGLGEETPAVCSSSLLVTWLVKKLSQVSPLSDVPSFARGAVLSALQKALIGLGDSALKGLAVAAGQGTTALSNYLTMSILPRLANDLNSALGSVATISPAMLNGIFNGLIGPLVEWAKTCGTPVAAAKTQADLDAAMKAIKDAMKGGYDQIKTSQAPQTQTLQQLDLKASYDVDKYKGLMSVVAAQQQCFQGGGAWYPGGADCEVGPGGVLQNCGAPYLDTVKKYNCVPPGTPGSTQQPMSPATFLNLKTGAATTTKSNMPLILGAAAIAALLLTRL